MMNKKKIKNRFSNFMSTLFLISIIVLLVAVVGGLIGMEIYVWVTYGGCDVSEIPAWALWFMFKGGH